MKGYRTLLFALLLAVAGAVQATLPAVQKYVTPELYGWATMGVAVLVAIFRIATDTAVMQKEPS